MEQGYKNNDKIVCETSDFELRKNHFENTQHDEDPYCDVIEGKIKRQNNGDAVLEESTK